LEAGTGACARGEYRAALSDAGALNLLFRPELLGGYTIELVVTDNLGAESEPDTVLINTHNTAPTAYAGDDQTLLVHLQRNTNSAPAHIRRESRV